MYKVFFNDRKLFLTDNFTRHFQVKYGLFYKFRDASDLAELINLYSKLSKIESLYLFHTELDELREAFRSCFIPIAAAGGLVRNRKGEFLLIFRRGKWDLPKGKLYENESVGDGAIREVQEECGITGIKLNKPLLSTYHTYTYKAGMALKKTSWFEMEYLGDQEPIPQKEEKITQVRWVQASKLDTYLNESYPAIKDVFTYFGV